MMLRPKNDKSYCVDVPGGTCSSNTQLITYKCHGGPNQQFRYNRRTKRIKSVVSGKCLSASSRKIVQKKCSNSKKQKWVLDNRGRYKNVGTRKCMDVEGGKYKNGKMIAYKCHNGPNQMFV